MLTLLTAGSSVDRPTVTGPWQLCVLLQLVVFVPPNVKANRKRRDPEEELAVGWLF